MLEYLAGVEGLVEWIPTFRKQIAHDGYHYHIAPDDPCAVIVK